MKEIPNTFKNIITLLFISLVFIPTAEVFVPYENKSEEECWEYLFFWEDTINLIVIITYAILWITYIIRTNNVTRILLIVFSVIILASGLLLALPSQDLVWSWGILLQFLLAVMILIYLVKVEEFKKG